MRPVSRLSVAAILLTVLLVGPLVADWIPARARQGEDLLSGSILYLSQAGIWRMDLATLRRDPFLSESAGIITHVSHSWDRQRIAYSMYIRGPRFEILESRIVITAANGTQVAAVVVEEGTGATLEAPSWSPTGTSLVYAKNDPSERAQRVEEVDLATGARRLVTEAGSLPSYTADGESILFASTFGQPWAIWRVSRTGGELHQLVPGTSFADLDNPLSAFDGRLIAFVGAQPAAPPPDELIFNPSAWLQTSFEPAVSAHPLPGARFGAWTVKPDGSDPRRAAELFGDNPYLAWSPDGRYLASWGRQGLQIVDMSVDPAAQEPQIADMSVDPAANRVRWLTALSGGGPISWGL
jgi:Tol biopolymer transport system component